MHKNNCKSLTDLFLPEGLDVLAVELELLLKLRHLALELVLGVLAPVQQPRLRQLEHRGDVLRPVEHRAVQLDVLH